MSKYEIVLILGSPTTMENLNCNLYPLFDLLQFLNNYFMLFFSSSVLFGIFIDSTSAFSLS